MSHLPLHAEVPALLSTSDPITQQPAAGFVGLRAVHRAAGDLKRGVPVLLRGQGDWVLLPVETAGSRSLAELSAVVEGPALLLLASCRAAALLQRTATPDGAAVAFLLPDLLVDHAALRGFADPTAEQLLPKPPFPLTDCPVDSGAALALLKLARLLPAALLAPVSSNLFQAGVDRPRDLLVVTAADVETFAIASATGLVRVAEAQVPLDGAPDARVVAFRAPDAGIEHLAILIGHPEQADAPLVRIHSECFTGDLLGSLRCDCGPQLRGAIRRMAVEGAGVLLYLAQEGRGIGLVNKLRAYAMQDRGLDTVDANKALGWGVDERNFLVAATMLDELAISRIRLLTNNPAKVAALTSYGIEVLHREQHEIAPNGVNDGYLATKANRLGHLIG